MNPCLSSKKQVMFYPGSKTRLCSILAVPEKVFGSMIDLEFGEDVLPFLLSLVGSGWIISPESGFEPMGSFGTGELRFFFSLDSFGVISQSRALHGMMGSLIELIIPLDRF